ncbi:glycosyltransferase [Dysgonomonas sp. HGC4]|uniref:glycosyltransferase n=1 Tax=Dysgonomonas sp. HGC4 TaxID=1658009 RepID=UPI00068325A8|nr:glycosyltransferase [Dysgonomonas sp. HGC4]MBD8349062.1 hypothetical protein [Dysgonomonas sp. HGC4]
MKKKILLLDSSYPINVRNVKILKTLENARIFDLSVISWNRDNRECKEYLNCKEYMYMSNTPYGSVLSKLLSLFSYFRFVKKRIKEINPDHIIASHWDMLFLASLCKGKKMKLVYENLDIPTANTSFIHKALRFIEKISLKKTDTIILASRFFEPKYRFFKGDKMIIENKPFENIMTDKLPAFEHDRGRLKISFIGGLRYFEVMKNLISAVKDLNIDLLFFGDGPDVSRFKDFATGYTNVFFFGRYNYDDIKCIYDLSDLVWAVYPSKDPNVKYAISNKFFESIVFSKPGFYCTNTELGDYAYNNGIGMKVDAYSVEGIRKVLLEIIRERSVMNPIVENMKKYKDKNALYWENHVQDLLFIFS